MYVRTVCGSVVVGFLTTFSYDNTSVRVSVWRGLDEIEGKVKFKRWRRSRNVRYHVSRITSLILNL